MFWVVFVLLLLTVSLAAQAQVPEGWFPFVIGESGSESLANVASYSSRPAGAEGFVTWRDGHFYDGGGRRLRFLGTNVTFASAFPDKDLAPRIAARSSGRFFRRGLQRRSGLEGDGGRIAAARDALVLRGSGQPGGRSRHPFERSSHG